jgi:hypothetical protein
MEGSLPEKTAAGQPRFRGQNPRPKISRQKTICHAKSRAVGAHLVWDYRSRHAMAYSTAVHPKIYWYPNKLQFVSWLEPPLPKSPNRCLI